MIFQHFLCALVLLNFTFTYASQNILPVNKVYGVNLGSWLVSEPWMFPKEWKTMGGESCSDCSTCAASEFDLVKKLGQTKADQVFAKHWSTWFTQDNVNAIADAKLNTVRIPLGYWIIESLVDRSTEYYPKGGLNYLKQGLRMLKAKGIYVILDFHALPGVAASQQQFAGRCTSNVQFYTSKNYNRTLTWAAMMTTMAHTDPDFSTVFSIEAVNEPLQDATKTPGLGQFEKNFVKTVRGAEVALGVVCEGALSSKLNNHTSAFLGSGLRAVAKTAEPAVAAALNQAASLLPGVYAQLQPQNIDNHQEPFNIQRPVLNRASSGCLMTSFMNKDWQRNNPANPADAAAGPQLYDAHLYFSFGGVADPNADSYMKTICNTDRVSKATQDRNRPLVFGEWSLATDFSATTSFLYDWADAQKYIYAGQADGWIFWSFKVEADSGYSPAWSYFDALSKGYFTKDPSKLKNPNVCAKWMSNVAEV